VPVPIHSKTTLSPLFLDIPIIKRAQPILRSATKPLWRMDIKKWVPLRSPKVTTNSVQL